MKLSILSKLDIINSSRFLCVQIQIKLNRNKENLMILRDIGEKIFLSSSS